MSKYFTLHNINYRTNLTFKIMIVREFNVTFFWFK